MVVENDSKENGVSHTAARTLDTGELLDLAVSDRSAAITTANTGVEDLGVLFQDHYQAIFRIAYRVTGSQSDAEDVLQTIFLRLTSAGSRSGLSANPKAYLYRSAINASLDLLRQRKRVNAVSLDVIDLDRSLKSLSANPEDVLVDTELRDLIRIAVAKLEGHAASAFVLRYYEGYDNSEIAKILGTSSLVIGVTLHRARTRLRKEIGNYLEKHNEAQ